jgi:hypothetical protein
MAVTPIYNLSKTANCVSLLRIDKGLPSITAIPEHHPVIIMELSLVTPYTAGYSLIKKAKIHPAG